MLYLLFSSVLWTQHPSYDIVSGPETNIDEKFMWNIFEEFCLLGHNAVHLVKKSNDDSEEHITSIFREEELTLKRKATCSPETSVVLQRVTRRYVQNTELSNPTADRTSNTTWNIFVLWNTPADFSINLLWRNDAFVCSFWVGWD
jgi:hypothetical protein